MLGKKGELNALMEEFKTVAPELKREMGQQLNKLKATALDRINALHEQLQDAISADGAATERRSHFGSARQLGSRHPISIGQEPDRRGVLAAGLHRRRRLEIEDDWHLLGAQFPARTSARDMRTVLHRKRIPTSCCARIPRRSGTHHGAPETAHPCHLPRPRVPQRSHFVPRALCIFRRSRASTSTKELSFADAKTIRATLLRQRSSAIDRHPHAPVVFPSPNLRPRSTYRATSAGGKGCPVTRYRLAQRIMGCGMVRPQRTQANPA